jgi:UDP-N-acetylmuramoylalanine--D-glutamate ligase
MRFSELDGRAVALWGLGRETKALARLLAERLPATRIAVVVLDDPQQLEREPQLYDEVPGLADATVVGCAQAVDALAGCNALIRSPGVSIHRPELRAATANGLPITTATGLWLAERGGRRVIGVTGTKGKSTTATIVAHLSSALRPTTLAGNIGRPVLELLDLPDDEWVVLELSSYQIADLPAGPEVAVITNLYGEHVDWHGSRETYRREKLRLFALPQVRAAAYSPADPQVAQAVLRVSRQVPFDVPSGWHLLPSGTVVNADAGTRIMPAEMPLRGRHNAENLCAALAALDAAGLALPELPQALTGLQALPHRLQTVLTSAGRVWVDDSISTTAESSLAALATFPDAPVVLIAGGFERQQDYRELGAELARRDAALVTLPDTGARLAQAATAAGLPATRLVEAVDMPAAVAAARTLATGLEEGTHAGTADPAGTAPGPAPEPVVILLSPAAPSYNIYRDFEARGDHFAALAHGGS